MKIKTFPLRSQSARTAIAVTALALSSACAVGPDFTRPEPIASHHYDQQAELQLGLSDGKITTRHIRLADEADSNWWSVFRSVKLDEVMQQAVSGNLDLAAADATIRQANEAVASSRGGLAPQFDFGTDAGRQRIEGSTSNLYPRLQLSGSLSEAGPGLGTLWNIVAGLTGPIFHGGALRANQRASIDGYQASLAGYRQTVFRSLGQVADILQAITHDDEGYAAQERALSAAEASLHLTQSGYRAGEIDVLQVLDAERAYQRALLGQIRARTARYLDTVQLSVALGGNARGAFARARLSSTVQ